MSVAGGRLPAATSAAAAPWPAPRLWGSHALPVMRHQTRRRDRLSMFDGRRLDDSDRRLGSGRPFSSTISFRRGLVVGVDIVLRALFIEPRQLRGLLGAATFAPVLGIRR